MNQENFIKFFKKFKAVKNFALKQVKEFYLEEIFDLNHPSNSRYYSFLEGIKAYSIPLNYDKSWHSMTLNIEKIKKDFGDVL